MNEMNEMNETKWIETQEMCSCSSTWWKLEVGATHWSLPFSIIGLASCCFMIGQLTMALWAPSRKPATFGVKSWQWYAMVWICVDHIVLALVSMISNFYRHSCGGKLGIRWEWHVTITNQRAATICHSRTFSPPPHAFAHLQCWPRLEETVSSMTNAPVMNPNLRKSTVR